jgi:hypothetical protein
MIISTKILIMAYFKHKIQLLLFSTVRNTCTKKKRIHKKIMKFI